MLPTHPSIYPPTHPSAAIEPPFEKQYGRLMDSVSIFQLRSADGLQIPLIVGPLRDIDPSTLAIDTVFNPAVIECCLSSPHALVFKQQIVELAFEWIPREAGS